MRCSTAGQDLPSQLDALQGAGCSRVFAEKVSTRVKLRPELQNALQLAWEIKAAVPQQTVMVTVHELKRLARNAAELITLAASLQTHGIQLESLTGPLNWVYDPDGMGSMLFGVCVVAAQLDRDYIREKTLEGQRAAAAQGRHGATRRALTMTWSCSRGRCVMRVPRFRRSLRNWSPRPARTPDHTHRWPRSTEPFP